MPGLVQQPSVRGTVRYNLPDLSVRPEDRGLFSGPAHKFGEDVDVDLYNPELAEEIIQGPEGLDVQGFTYVKHKSVLGTDDWLEGNNVEEKYVPEVEELVKQVTGATKVIVNHLGIRKRLSASNNDPTFYRRAGDQHDEAVKRLTEKNAPWGKSMPVLLAFRQKGSNLCPQSTVAQTRVSSPPDLHTATTP
jgi:GA4 desaturase